MKLFALISSLLLILLITTCSKNPTGPDDNDIKISISFVTIPGGTFQMGDVEDAGDPNEKPVHTVTISTFEMSAYEITNAQYAEYLNEAKAANAITATSDTVKGSTGAWSGQEYIYLAGDYSKYPDNDCKITYNNGSFSVKPGYETWPVTWVTWYGAKAFTEHYGIDLPREAEWEYASRWGSHQYKYGTNDGTIRSSNANYNSNIGHPVAVGSYPANPFGLHDMSGNVWEWCVDWYGAYPRQSKINPTGALTGTFRVGRGGGWENNGKDCRSASRDKGDPNYRHDIIGFRVVLRPYGTNTVSGRILYEGNGLTGVTVSMDGESTSTDTEGYYSFTSISDGNYTLNFTKSDYTFNPSRVEVTVNGNDVTIEDVTAVFGDNPLELTFVTIPGGTFQMGDVEDAGSSNEKPVHSVTISTFEMSAYEITNAQYAEYLNEAKAANAITATSSSVTGTTGSWSSQEYIYLAGDYSSYPDNDCKITYNGSFSVKPGYETWPVTCVTWYGAKAFTEHYDIDLPREAEWEYASRWGSHQYLYGTNDGTISSSNANYYSNIGHPVAVGSYPANPFELHDMCGNVDEWCEDWYGSYTSESQTNPTGAQTGPSRVLRGGDWYRVDILCRSASRDCVQPNYRYDTIGFRVVRRPAQQ